MYELMVGRRKISITNGDKIIFPKTNISKKELIDYYYNIANIMVPYMKNRPLTMQRFVHGADKEGFYQKNASDYFPSWIKRIPIKKKEDGLVNYVVCNNAPTLVYLANQLSITFHVWLSRVDKLNFPDRMIFDLDPSVKGFAIVRFAARQLNTFLRTIGLIPFVMTTGSRGLHVVVPLDRKADFDTVRSCARDIADLLVARYPAKFTTEIRKVKRGKRLFIDTLRNSFAQTGVAPYSVRARPGAPIATPIFWDELGTRGMRSDKFTIKTIFRRLSRKDDPWHDIDKYACSLKKARKQLDIIRAHEGLLADNG